jgi:hypothetical protein
MSHFAKVENGIVTEVIVVEQDVIDSGIFGEGWVQTGYNTRANKHELGGVALRGNFAGIGSIYDSVRDVFYIPQPFTSWILNETTYTWESPVPHPQDGNFYQWDEPSVSWVLVSTSAV